ncbi:hypothetical protein K490DRAFT_13120, partial [Saccharata proteae CBS 121410]
MLTSGFTHAPISRILVFYLVAAALAASITDSQYLLYIQIDKHLWVHRQFWRGLTWQASYVNSTEVLFAAMAFYQLRVIERLWGSRKFASFLLTTLPWTTLLPPILLALVLRPLTFNHANYLPAGPTPILFALLAQYHAAIPQTYRLRLATSASASSPSSSTAAQTSSPISSSTSTRAFTISNKIYTYLLPLQLSLSALPGSALAALVGWCVGYAWRNEMLPGATWRVPRWVVGEKEGSAVGGTREFEGLRRRL